MNDPHSREQTLRAKEGDSGSRLRVWEDTADLEQAQHQHSAAGQVGPGSAGLFCSGVLCHCVIRLPKSVKRRVELTEGSPERTTAAVCRYFSVHTGVSVLVLHILLL